ncbi:diacylglycerol/lipid kinase family protein [Buchananella felis]|uniref:diacylglycerol/lipid kinase family protein n=1 Tax=Buchananella felis TaxID=3231492 RepID=UPI00352719DE
MEAVTWIALGVALAGLAAGLVALAVALRLRGELRGGKGQEGIAPAPQVRAAGSPYVIHNPSKLERTEELEALVLRTAMDAGLAEPVWLETTVEDPGTGQARQAVEAGASVVVAVGGDGTVRSVAAGLAGSEVPMAILPQGTGNLLARNLELPLSSLAEQLRVAFTGHNRRMDVGWLAADVTEDAGQQSVEPGFDVEPAFPPAPATTTRTIQPFLVISGVGFDGAVMESVGDGLKDRVGWMAYVLASTRHLWGKRMRARLELGAGEQENLAARSVLIANCGRLQGGVQLVPDAQLDDGWLDVVAVDTAAGPVGWMALAGGVMTRGIGPRRAVTGALANMIMRRTRTLSLRLRSPQPTQVDGDYLGRAVALHARLQRGALLVRVP